MSRLFVNRLTAIDFSYLHPQRGLLGESWLVDIELRGGLDEQGMVLDFGEVKRRVKQLIDEGFDHKLLVPLRHPALQRRLEPGLDEVTFVLEDGAIIRHRAPAAASAYIDAEQITLESVGEAIEQALMAQMPDNVESLQLRLYPEPADGAFYHYSHGLKLHCGNCQRIAHGHRSRIRILRNGERDAVLEADWAGRWHDCYIATREDLADELTIDGRDYLRFAYSAPQGDFELQLPASACYLVDCETTVENLAQHVAERLRAEGVAGALAVHAYEGVDKGAVGEA